MYALALAAARNISQISNISKFQRGLWNNGTVTFFGIFVSWNPVTDFEIQDEHSLQWNYSSRGIVITKGGNRNMNKFLKNLQLYFFPSQEKFHE